MSTPQRPNLILITTDQQRFDTVGRYGNPDIYTPHLNWMADTGVLCRRAYSDAPVCCPARATMITGMHYRNMHGYGGWGPPTAPDAATTLPGLLTRQGYQTRSIGKVHYHPPRCHYGFEHMEILEDYYRFMRQFPDRGIPMDHGMGQNEMEPVISTVDESWSLTRWLVNRAIDFVETRDPTRPFFLNLGFAKPHAPFDPCLNYWQLYAQANLPAPAIGDWSADPARIPSGFLTPTWTLNGGDRLSPQVLQQAKKAYYACITQIDYNLGYLLARLRELDLLDHSLIIFTADHGEMMGDHHMGAKTVFLEGSAHVPMLVRGPAELVSPDQVGRPSEDLFCLADLMPTFLAAAGVPAAAQPAQDGLNILDVLHGRARGRSSFIGAYAGQFCVLREGWKYIYTNVGGAELLFDLAADPYEQKNLATQPAHASRKAALHRELVEALTASGSADVADGRFVVKPVPKESEERLHRWPGFHSREFTPVDVLH